MDNYTPTPDYYYDYICHAGVKGMKWKKGTKGKKVGDKYYYYQPKANPNNSAAYNQLAGMESSAYQKLLGKIKLTKGGKGKSSTDKKGTKGAKNSTDKGSKSASAKSSTATSEKSSVTSDKKAGVGKTEKQWREEEFKVNPPTPVDYLERIRKNYKAKKGRNVHG